MKDNGTDRDIALLMADALNTCAGLVSSINDKLYAPHITTQPSNYVGELNETASFSVVADNAKAYRWEVKRTPTSEWDNSGASGSSTATMSIAITEARLTNVFRCKITGLDDSIIYTDEVHMELAQG